MRILITGGAGFIGANFVHHVVKNRPDYFIVNLDKLTYAGSLKYLEGLPDAKNYIFVHGDILDKELVNSLFAQHKIDTVVHFAAETHVDNSISRPADFVETNVLGTHLLLEVAKKHHVRLFFHISTDEVYGSIPMGFVEETALLNPSSPYSASKASSDLLVTAYYKTFGLPVLITRSCNNYGRFQHAEKFIPTVVRQALHNRLIPVYGQGFNRRTWLNVEDNCRGILFLLEQGKIGEIYNISSQEEYENIETVKLILQILGKSENLISFVQDRPGHDLRYGASSAKIRSLGWKPEISFEDGLKDYVLACQTKVLCEA